MPVHSPLFPALLLPFIPQEFAHYENIPQTSNIAILEAIYERTAPHYAVIASWIGHLLVILAINLTRDNLRL